MIFKEEQHRSGNGTASLSIVISSVALISVIAFLVWSLIPKTAVYETPETALLRITEAVKERDLPKFRRYVDVDMVAERMVDVAFDSALQEMRAEYEREAKKNPFAQIGNAIGSMFLVLMKPTISTMLKQQAEHWVETGEMKEISPLNDGDDAPAISKQKQPEVSLKQLADRIEEMPRLVSVKIEGKQARATLEFTDEAEQKRIVQLRLREVEGAYWQLAEIENFKELLKLGDTEKRSSTGS